ncbi:hypothetical protein [Pantanalinema sp. GBBB05]|uniref:hypothetical protein n=1 Tax=Pantanalinema sp. GBBB05 TaxID=2604139 RepID=UPI001DB6410A|nr:hypothetical protein [Pantanalinema sp. GBBB05]
MGGISLAIGSRSLSIVGFDEFKMPRIEPELSQERSAYNTFVAYGLAYEQPNLWEFTPTLSQTDWITLQGIYQEHMKRRRFDSTDDPRVLLTDTLQLFVEASPRTREKAPAPNDIEIIQGSDVAYYAQFYVWFVKPPEIAGYGWKGNVRYYTVSVAFEECDEKVIA